MQSALKAPTHIQTHTYAQHTKSVSANIYPCCLLTTSIFVGLSHLKANKFVLRAGKAQARLNTVVALVVLGHLLLAV